MTPPSRSRSTARRNAVSGRISLIHWNESERAKRMVQLGKAGFAADPVSVTSPGFKKLFTDPPVAFVVDLSRLPSHGRDIALSIRERKSTRLIPLVFVGGDADKVKAIQRILPDATYTTWRSIKSALNHALRNPPENPVVPTSRMAGYSGTPLPQKLGIKPGFDVLVVDAPPGFEKVLGAIPDGSSIHRRKLGAILGKESPANLAMWFVTEVDGLVAGTKHFGLSCPPAGVWIVWRKKTAYPADAAGFGEREVRERGLAAGLVDFKICAVDATWSGLKFTIPRSRKTQ